MAGPRRLFSLAAVLSLLLLLLTTRGAQGQPGASIQPPVVEEPVDLDGNGLYDELRLQVTLNVRTPGTYLLSARFDSSYTAFAEKSFTMGFQEEVLRIPGDIVHGRGDGPYRFVVSLSDVRANYLVIDRREAETMPYLAVAFEFPFISFRAPFVDRVTDLNENGLWDELVIDVGLDVRRSLTVWVAGSIRFISGEPRGHDLHLSADELHVLEVGESVVGIVFPGHGFSAIGRDGPYNISVSIRTEESPLRRLYNAEHQTAAYRVTEFEKTSADFSDRPPESHLVDANGNGLADFLLLEVPLEVREAGDFLLRGDFMRPCRPSCTWHTVSQRVHLEPGNRSIALTVGGVNLQRAPEDGPWSVQLFLRRLDGATFSDFRSMEWTTPAFSRSEFEAPQPLVLKGTVRTTDGRPVTGQITVFDAERKFRTTGQAWLGEYGLTLYEGAFTLFFPGRTDGLSPGFVQGEFRVDLRNDTARDFVLTPRPADAEVYDLTVNAGDAATVVATRTSHAPTIRAEADFNGDFDGVANETELALLAPKPPLSLLEVEFDGVPLVRSRTMYRVVSGAGSYMDPGSLVTSDTVAFRGQGAFPGAAPGSVTIRMVYDSELLDLSAVVRLPPAFDTALFSNSPNVTVRQLDLGTWEVDPGREPPAIERGAAFPVVVEISLSLGLDPVQRGLLVLAGMIPVGVFGLLWRLRVRKKSAERSNGQ